MALGREYRHELRVALVPGGRIDQRLEMTARRVGSAGSAEVHAKRSEDLRQIGLKALALPACQGWTKVRQP